jgi:hypothetical protein
VSARFGLAAVMGAVGFVALDFLCSVLHLPLFFYEPIQRVWVWGRYVQSPAMDLYGHLLWCLVGGALGFAAGWLLFKAPDDASTARWARRGTGWLLSLLVLAAALHVTTLAQRHPTPLERPR